MLSGSNVRNVAEIRYLALRVRPRADKNTQSQKKHTQHLEHAIPLSSDKASKHSRYTAEATQDDMYRYADIIRKGPIVEHVDAEMHHGSVGPFSDRYFGSL